MFLLTQASPLIWFSLDGDKTSDNRTEICLVAFPSFLEINSYQNNKKQSLFSNFQKKGGAKKLKILKKRRGNNNY